MRPVAARTNSRDISSPRQRGLVSSAEILCQHVYAQSQLQALTNVWRDGRRQHANKVPIAQTGKHEHAEIDGPSLQSSANERADGANEEQASSAEAISDDTVGDAALNRQYD